MPYLKRRPVRRGEKSKGGESCTSVQSPVSVLARGALSHLTPGMELCAETEYVGATAGVPLLAE